MPNTQLTQPTDTAAPPVMTPVTIEPGTMLRDGAGQTLILVSDLGTDETHARLILEGHLWSWPRASVLTLVRGLLRDGWSVAVVLSAEHVEALVEEAQERAAVLGRCAGRRAA